MPAALLGSAGYAPSVGWDLAAASYCLWVWLAIWPMDATATAQRAKSEDPNRALSDVIALTACVASIAGGSEPGGGVDFHCDDKPCDRDFAYIGLTVGATFQVSDTDLLTTTFRATVLRQTQLSYLFGAVILGVTVNMVASCDRSEWPSRAGSQGRS